MLFPIRLLIWTAALLLPAPALAQLAAPRLELLSTAEQPIVLRSVTIRTEIDGSLALTSVELRFFNPNRRQLEGELQFPLLDGQSVVGMAMDVDGRLREAVPVDKARGRQVFEDVTRASIDPALLSVTQGNNYKLRVYPILPQRDKVVVLRYAETLVRHGDAQRYRVPLYYADRLPELAVAMRVVGAAAAPATAAGALMPPVFTRDGDAFVLDVSRRDFTGKGVLEVDIPAPSQPQAFTQVRDGRTYVHVEIPMAPQSASRALPPTMALAWDSSGSGARRDHAREFALLDAYFARARDIDVRLVRVRDTAEAAQVFIVRSGNWQALRKALAATIYDGATNLGAYVADPAIPETLLFSDGLSNFGEAPLAVVPGRLYAVSAAGSADRVLLRHAAERNGGRFIDLASTGAAEAAALLLTESSRVVGMEGRGVHDVVASSPFPMHGRLNVAGILDDSTAELRVTLAHPGGRRQTITVPLSSRRNPGALAASMWARYRIDTLDADHAANRGEILRLGKAFGLVTRETSLIVLDRVEDYARHEITPPTELMAAYEQARAATRQRDDVDRTAHLERIVTLFEQKQAWWERRFPKDARPAPTATKDLAMRGQVAGAVGQRADLERRLASSIPGMVPSPPPSAPAAAAPMEDRAGAASTVRAKTSGEVVAARAASGNPAARDAMANAVSNDAAATTIQLRRWTPDAPYLARLRDAAPADVYPAYLKERAQYLDSTAFFIDAADVLFERGQADLAQRVLSNLAEMDLENRHVLRILGLRLMQAQRPALALPVLRKVLELAPDEPQSYRDLGLAHAACGQRQQAVDMLREVVDRSWNARFPEIELIALAELNAIIATSPTPLDTSRLDPRLGRNLPLALRVILAWDADNTDIDLWVTDPNGERAFYGNKLSYQGGRMSPDFTGGYGPEEFSLRQAKPGRYKVEANYYGNRQQIVAGATTLQVKLATGFGTARQKEQSVTLRLKDRQEVVFVGEFEVAAD